MTRPVKTMAGVNQVRLEFEELRARLEEAEQTLQAIRDGEVDALVVTGQRGQQIYTLRGADQPYRVFVEQMHEGAVTLSEDGVVLYSNQRFADLLDQPLGKVIGCLVFDLIAEESRIELQSLLAQARKGNAKGEVVLSSSSQAPVLLSLSLLGEDQDAFFSMIVTDLTDRKKGAEVMAAERLARSILDNATEAIVVCDAEGRIVRANAEAERLAGRGLSLAPFCDGFDLCEGEASAEGGLPFALAGTLRGEVVKGWEATLRRSGVEVDVLASAGPLIGQDGREVVGCVVTMIDITDRNAAFRSVRELNDSLERRVEARTEQLQAANRELEGFCYSVSHDLRAPLRSMIASASILLEDHSDGLDDSAREMLRRLSRASSKMGNLIDDLLQFSRLTRRPVNLVPIDLSRIARNIVDDLQSHPEYRHLETVIEPGLEVQGDFDLIRMALENLLSNAFKFSRNNLEGRVWVGREVHDGRPAFFVRDNGVGFDQRYVEKVFLPFERLHNERDFPGTGIGLANVHRIVSRHGGRIWAEGETGKGATFYFSLP